MSRARLIVCVLLPFAAGYYLSYLFRTINALIASDLTAELNLGAADLGLLTSVYFLVFAAVQLPLGALLDRYGPRTIQSALLLLASAGALVFALADSLLGLVIGRALLGLGVAVALMAGFKAIVLWFPPDRLALASGWLVMLGALGAVTATAPAECVVAAIGWRGLFTLLAGLSSLAAVLVLFAVPEPSSSRAPLKAPRPGLWVVYRDRRFWRIAPLSAVGIGTSWSLQGLWAAPWLRDVGGLDRAAIVQHLSVMAVSVCASALLLGMAADRLRRRGLKTELVLASTLGASMTAQVALVLGWPISSLVLWSVIAAAGAATVLSFAILSEYFPKHMSGRGNAALNLLHVGAAFVLQSASGFVIQQWPEAHGTYPAEAHQLAMGATVVLQLLAFAWFALPPQRLPVPSMARAARRSLSAAHAWPARAPAAYATTALAWTHHADLVPKQGGDWRIAATASTVLCIGLAAALSMTISSRGIAVHVFEIDSLPNMGRSSIAGLIDGAAALEPTGPTKASPRLIPSAFVQPEPIPRPPPATQATNVRAQRR
jgi:MFS family permease